MKGERMNNLVSVANKYMEKVFDAFDHHPTQSAFMVVCVGGLYVIYSLSTKAMENENPSEQSFRFNQRTGDMVITNKFFGNSSATASKDSVSNSETLDADYCETEDDNLKTN